MKRSNELNSTIARLDRIADRMGFRIEHLSRNRRGFEAMGRKYTYRPAGAGTVSVEVRDAESSKSADAVVVVGVDRVSALFMLAAETRS